MKKLDKAKNFINNYSRMDLSFRPDWSKWRSKHFDDLLAFLDKKRITANQITAISAFIGILGAICLWHSWMGLALFLLCLHLVGDTLDGPLAKYTYTDSNKGGFTDVCADQIVLIAVIFALLDTQRVAPLAGCFFILGHTIIVGFAMVRNAMGIPYKWLIHPRIFLYINIFAEHYFLPGTLQYLVYIFNGIFILRITTGFMHIRKEL